MTQKGVLVAMTACVLLVPTFAARADECDRQHDKYDNCAAEAIKEARASHSCAAYSKGGSCLEQTLAVMQRPDCHRARNMHEVRLAIQSEQKAIRLLRKAARLRGCH
jgi:hypothetical protein